MKNRLRRTAAWFSREYRLCRSELDRLRNLSHRPASVVGAIGASGVVVALGNAVVLAGGRWEAQREWFTLLGVPAIAVAGTALLARRGWARRDLGLRWPAVDPPRRFTYGVLAVAVTVSTASGLIGRITGEDVPALGLTRLLLGTALGEELVHRGVVLGVWTATPVAGGWVVVANMGTFALWHLASATHGGDFRWWEVAGPGALAILLLWARLRTGSIVAPAAFHAASNMTEFLPRR